MKPTLTRRRFSSLAALTTLAGCASPAASYYRLAPSPGTPHPGTPITIGIRSIDIPPYLDQNSIPRSSPAYQYSTFPNDLWAEPLAAMLQTVLIQNLSQRLPAATIIATNSAIGTPPDLIVEINVLHFDPDPTGLITLTAQAATRPATQPSPFLTRTLTATAQTTPTPATITATMSTLWATAADQITAMILQSQ